ncbi:MAG TPA: tetratricopeptide repeat protein [Bryobacteraceae bacterium]|nr:tetratricopeptide repeat protein [Bryobacteraceae bacterium]
MPGIIGAITYTSSRRSYSANFTCYGMQVMRLFSRTGCALIISLPWLALAQNAPDVQHRVEELEQRAQNYLQEQKPQLAIPVLRDIVSLDPKNAGAQGNLGVLLFFQSKYADAIPHMRAALQLQPNLWRIEALLGTAEKRTGNLMEAQKDLERAFSNLDDKKVQIEAGLELIELYSASAQLDKALSVAVKLEELAPQNPQILLAAHQISRQVMDQSLLSMMMIAPDSAEMHMIMAGEFGRQGDHANAIREYREALRLNPMLPGAHFQLAEQLRTSSNPAWNAQAEDEYKAALRVNQYDELSWRQLGGIIEAKGDYKAAAEDYKRALALQPRDSDAETGLAIAFTSMDQTNEAISLLESAVKDDPTNVVAHYRLSGLYRRAGRTADAQREMDTFHHYKDVKDKLGKVFKNLTLPSSPM